jgi:glycosyltransferase involved in cell wall biosynthesis
MTQWDVMLVSHEASRTGAPRVATELSKGFIEAGLRVLVVLRWDGPLRADFEATGATVITEPGRHLRVLMRKFRFGKHLALSWEKWIATRLLRYYQPKAVYLNTALSLTYAQPAVVMLKKVAVHLHEVDDWLQHALDRYPLEQDQASEINWAHCAQRSADILCKRYPLARSQFIPSGIDTVRVREQATLNFEKELPEQFIVNCATADRRKGVDIWLRMCEKLAENKKWSELHFVWIGKITQVHLIEPYRKKPFFKHVHFLGEVDNPHPIIRKARLMVLTSRQDAYPLVVLEAQALCVPVVAFDVGDVKDQVPRHHLVLAENENDLLLKVLYVLSELPPVLAFEKSKHGIEIVRQRAIELLS